MEHLGLPRTGFAGNSPRRQRRELCSNREMDSDSLYRDVVEKDGVLREILRSQPCNAPNALFHRANLMEKAEQFVSMFPGVAASKETEQVLWKPCFYKRIEDFRRRIRKYASQSGNDKSVRDHFFKLSGEFQSFLDEAAAYYERLHGYFAASRSGHIGDAIHHSMFRCLIFLGDIARYRELHSQKAKKNFRAAEGFYHRALEILPDNGNPHNQLAVLATYVEAETIAVYRYCRSLLLPKPFATAEENLVLLFERSRHRAFPAVGHSASITSSSPPKDKSAYLKGFLHRLTRLHGLMVAPTADEGYLPTLEANVCESFTSLLAAGVLGDALVLKLFAINIYCICRSNPPMQSLAVGLTLKMATLVLGFVHDKLFLLGPVSVLCDFFRAHPHYLTDSSDHGTVVASPLVAWVAAIATALNKRHADSFSGPITDAAKVALMKPRLKETVELNFFEPLGVEYALRGSEGITSVLPDVESATIRWSNIHWFAVSTLIPQHLLYEHHCVWSISPPSPDVVSPRPPSLFGFPGGPALSDQRTKYLSSGTSTNQPSGDENDDDEDCGEVIVFQPLRSTPQPPSAASLPRPVLSPVAPSSSLTALTDSPSFGGADLSAFTHLGGGLRPLEDLTWGKSPSVVWHAENTSVPSNMMGSTWNDLDAVEEEGTRYEHQTSTLSMLFEATEKATPNTPPGFRNMLVTTNPFVVAPNT
ncbi:hypothetical protein H310_12100 [Aphanomyces invadans]|uniref:DNA/RNA-binding domain-containing protein n=1 Tax=Aphanomyces invadans TaxID=157072 RepID=A0A024TJ39_9STRA|nr:hypothetical protein H310_12100 [Aphanomyces invadans]ETV94068.1 hypothetical protein H310_12100 [Aphanomyces invadans]|eukprot:XP_008877271.1 hypothetical protein H310_12100 [Aphanomyces invadans]